MHKLVTVISLSPGLRPPRAFAAGRAIIRTWPSFPHPSELAGEKAKGDVGGFKKPLKYPILPLNNRRRDA
jgi:hypothetical protein